MQKEFAVPDNLFLTDRHASKFILTWMRDLRAFQKEFGALFGRKKQPPLADDFTAALALCLEQFLTARGYPGRVRCEETTHKERGATRPDVSVFSATGGLIATVECKANLGWNRNRWRMQCESRSAALVERFSSCKSYLCVLTQSNFNVEEFLSVPCAGIEWVCLCRVGVGKISDPAQDILQPIEPMFLDIFGRLTN